MASLESYGKSRISIWDKSVAVEESHYYWKNKPVEYIRPIVHSSKYKIVELFCGCGGLSTGFEMAGFDVVLGADIHQPSAKTFFLNHKKSTVILGDLKEIEDLKIKSLLRNQTIDVTVAGVPCQGFSLNNRKRNEFDGRNYLFKEYIRFVKTIKPKIVLLENVSGMKSAANGSFIEAIENELRLAGYPNVFHKTLNAADFGVPQIRQRLIFVACLKDIEFCWPQETHGPKGRLSYLTVKDAIGDLPALEASKQTDEYDKEPFTKYQKSMRGNIVKLANHEAPNHPFDTIHKIANTKPGKPMYSRFKQRIRLSWENPSPTQVSGGIRPQFQFGHPEQARGLTIRERMRLQSFPDSFIVEGGIVQGRVQSGNAVPPLLAKAIALKIKEALNELKKVKRHV